MKNSPDFRRGIRPVPAVAAFVEEEGRLLMIRRGKEPAKGLWCVHGGSIELGETVEQALVREVAEETGLHIRAGELLTYVDAIYPGESGFLFHYVILYLSGRIVGGQLRAGDDASEVGLFSLAELRKMEVEPKTMEIVEGRWSRSETAGPP